jgi:hypothetical protein
MPPLTPPGLLRCNRRGISVLHKNKTRPPTLEKAMILFTSSTQNIAIVRDMMNAWFAHHQRLADLGVSGDL